MFNLKVYLACSSVATWHWDWTCASSLLNDGLDSVSHTRLFIWTLNLVFTVIWYLFATHLHVFFPSMVCVSQEHSPCGYCTCLKVINSMICLFDWPLRLWTIFFPWWIISVMQSFLQQEDFFFFVILLLCIFIVGQLPSALMCLLWISQCFKDVIASCG